MASRQGLTTAIKLHFTPNFLLHKFENVVCSSPNEYLRLSVRKYASYASKTVSTRLPGISSQGLCGALQSSWWRFHSSGFSSNARGRFSRRISAKNNTPSLEIRLVPCLKDNYAYLIRDPEAHVTAIVDPSEARPVVEALTERQLTLTHILNTHHHWDHTGGNVDLKFQYNAKVVGPKADKERIPGIDIALGEGDTWQFGNHQMEIIDTPGHTRGHVSFYFPKAKALFTGDTLFSLGCGRLFEGTPQEMWASLSKLMDLPPETQIFCGHEYTQSNAKFALHVDPHNARLEERAREIARLRSEGQPTIPVTLGKELLTNPFLRPFSSEIRSQLSISADATDAEAFGAIRKAKDNF